MLALDPQRLIPGIPCGTRVVGDDRSWSLRRVREHAVRQRTPRGERLLDWREIGVGILRRRSTRGGAASASPSGAGRGPVVPSSTGRTGAPASGSIGTGRMGEPTSVAVAGRMSPPSSKPAAPAVGVKAGSLIHPRTSGRCSIEKIPLAAPPNRAPRLMSSKPPPYRACSVPPIIAPVVVFQRKFAGARLLNRTSTAVQMPPMRAYFEVL